MAQATYSRSHLEKIIREGGSVLHGGAVITRLEDLPTEAQLAAGNPVAEEHAMASLDAQMQALADQKARLGAQQKERESREKREAEQRQRQAEADQAAAANAGKQQPGGRPEAGLKQPAPEEPTTLPIGQRSLPEGGVKIERVADADDKGDSGKGRGKR